jgi:hypothetical protein
MVELEADCAKIPSVPAPSIVHDSDEQEQWVQDLYNDPVSRMILESIEEPGTPPPDPLEFSDEGDASPAKSDSTNSATPCPIFCQGCGLISDGDNLPDQVQCENCRFWSHTECLQDDVDWDAPSIKFVCARCQPQAEAEL